jgi:ketosteroid isomerase-like protein
MGAARDGYTIVSFAYEKMDIDVFGDTGIVHSRYSQVASYQHTSLSNVFRLTDVWHKGDGRWQVVARHSSILG